jgi:energy-coupling factor transporter ATP-binding protein EcfA2
MTVSIHFSKITFSSGKSVSIKPDTVLVLVGPNSSGKSQSLRDITDLLRDPKKIGKAVQSIEVVTVGDDNSYLTFLEDNSKVQAGSRQLIAANFSPPDAANSHWSRKDFSLVGGMFAKLIATTDRLSALTNNTRIDRQTQIAKFPLPALDLDPAKEREVSASFCAVFGSSLSLDRCAGAVVNMHIGSAIDPQLFKEPYSPSYSDEVRKMPLLIDEGDGVKALAGLVLEMIGLPKSIYLIDEPDAYLHPPQAKAAAAEMVKISQNRQLFVATHNAHFLRGLLETDRTRLTVVRLDRDTGVQSVHIIDNQIFEDIKSDPLIKFTSLLECLFFRTVVICENEADCLFYRSLLSNVDKQENDENIFWISAHGKQNIKKLAKIIRAMGVCVISIPDLDIINDKQNLKGLIESHGGQWSDFEADFSTVSTFIGNRKPTFALADVRTKITAVLQDAPINDDGLFPERATTEIKDILRSASPWRELKESGISTLGRGQPHKAAISLLDKMRKIGIVTPEVGEMESFYPSCGLHGIEWVNNALALDIANDPEMAQARKFADQLNGRIAQ